MIVVTGAGRGFCAGADSQALSGHVDRGGYDAGTPADLANPGYGVSPEFDHDFAFHFGLTKPVIAAVNGPAAGVGLVLACYCDLRFAAAGAKLTTAHGKLNLPAEYGLSWLLPRLIGLGRANDLLLSSRVVLAEEALEMGLVNAVVDARRAARPHLPLRHGPRRHGLGRLAGRHQAPDRPRPAPRRGCSRGRVGRAAWTR